MGKTIGLQQLAAKKYILVPDLPPELVACIGEIEDAFDMILWGGSNNGKSSAAAKVLIPLIKALKCKARYIAYEEAHGKTVQDTFIKRFNMLEEIGNAMTITDHLSYDELDKEMGKKKSPKIWIIDSIQASGFTAKQIADLKAKYVTSKKRKILIVISWEQGKEPDGAAAKSVKYYANIKLRVKDLLIFPKSRYGGGDVYVIHEETARKRLGDKAFNKLTGRTGTLKKRAG